MLRKRTYVRYPLGGDARRVPRGAVPQRAQPGAGDAVRLVAQPVHGLRPPLHVLLRPRLRGARRPSLGRPLRLEHPRQDERRDGSATRARAAELGARDGRDRRGDRPVPAGGGPLPADARLPRGARGGVELVRDHHARAAHRPGRRRPRRGRPSRRGLRDLLRADARPGDLAADRAGHGAAAPAAARPREARRRGDQRRRRDGADPPRAQRQARAPRRRRPRGARRRSDGSLGEPPLPPPRHARALPRRARTGLAGAPARVRGALPARCLPAAPRDRSRPRTGARARPPARRPRPAPRPDPSGETRRTAQSRYVIADPGSMIGAVVTGSEITTLIVDDHEVVREGLRLSLSRAPHIRVVGEASDGESAVALAERRRPNVIIMDVRMPGMDGLEATKILSEKVPDSAVLIFTAYSERSLLSRGLDSGAKGYILKEAPHETLVRAIENVHDGEGYVDPALMPAFLSGKDKEEMLTTREREILQLLADGMSNADVATKLFISQETVKSHVRHILAKLEADTRTHAVAIALREAIID